MEHRAGAVRLLGAAVAFALTVGLGVGVAGNHTAQADAENTKNVIQDQAEAIGQAAGIGAVAGPTTTVNHVTLPQINVQVIAGDASTHENSTQTATNTANIEQTAAAGSGDATAEDGSTATTGAATAGNIAVGMQLNIQVIAGIGCDVDQIASNTLDLSQDAGAMSGDAQASGGGDASSGSASALNTAKIRQSNLQVYVCRGGATGQQTAENIGEYDQGTGALSGDADADQGSASTGSAEGQSDLNARQWNRQITID